MSKLMLHVRAFSSERSLTDTIKLADPENPLLHASIWDVSTELAKFSQLCAENCKFLLSGNEGLSEPNLTVVD